jgi:hypothetical protein
MGEDSLAQAAAALRQKALGTLNQKYWREGEGYYAFGILRSGKTNDNLTVWPATAAAFGLLQPDHAERMMARLAGDAMSTDWGARPLSSQSPLYDPMHYNNGAVWPFVTGFVTWGQYHARRPWSGYPLIDVLARMTFDWARGRHPELLSGQFYRPLDTAVPQQFFATSMLVSPLIYGLLGWEPDAPAGRARLVPQLPPTWGRVDVRHLRVGASHVTAELRRTTLRAGARLSAIGPAVNLELVQSVPLGAREIRATLDGKVVEARPEAGAHDQSVQLALALSAEPRQVEVSWTGGMEIEPPLVALVPGQTSQGLRVLDFRAAASGWALVVEGSAGRSYQLGLRGESVGKVDGASVVRHDEPRTVLEVTFPAGTARATRSITIRPVGR